MALTPGDAPRIEIDGLSPTAGQLAAVALSGYGHFTAMQVRGGRTRGLDLHFTRLDAANREVFGQGLDPDRVRGHIRHALGDDIRDASVRVYVQELTGRVSVMVTVRPPGTMPAGPWRLQTAPYQRPVAHIKHVGDFGQVYYQRLAHRRGFDDALLTGPGEICSEGSITNIGFYDGQGITWPDAPVLHGITMQLLNRRLDRYGLPARRAPVRVPDVGSFAAAFVTNARGIAPVGQIDDISVPVDAGLMKTLAEAYDSTGWDRI